MSEATLETAPDTLTRAVRPTALGILFAISASHLLNDTFQSLLPAIYPLLERTLSLSYSQIGLTTFTFQVTASILQPIVGLFTDRKPLPYSLACGMGFTLAGLAILSQAASFPMVLLAAGTIGLGSSIFHPEASRVARMASGGKLGFAQSLFQVGGNAGSSFGPLIAAVIIVPRGQATIVWFTGGALLGIALLTRVGSWYGAELAHTRKQAAAGIRAVAAGASLERWRVLFAMSVLVALIFSKYFYLSSMTNYYTFFLIRRFGVDERTALLLLFVFQFSVAVGTFVGGPVGDRIGRKNVIWASILGVAPFSIALPHMNLFWTAALTIPIGLILASAFSAILVYAQELVPGRVGMISGLFFGFAFGIAGIASAVLGRIADSTGIEFVFGICAFLPLLGLLAAFLPRVNLKHAS